MSLRRHAEKLQSPTESTGHQHQASGPEYSIPRLAYRGQRAKSTISRWHFRSLTRGSRAASARTTAAVQHPTRDRASARGHEARQATTATRTTETILEEGRCPQTKCDLHSTGGLGRWMDGFGDRLGFWGWRVYCETSIACSQVPRRPQRRWGCLAPMA